MNSNKNEAARHPVKRLLIFQVKLAVDALRDIMLSPVSLICTVVDSIQNRCGENSYFEKLMVFGRNTEKRINLFEQHNNAENEQQDVSIDSILNRVEGIILKEYKEKHISKKTLSTIESVIKSGKKS